MASTRTGDYFEKHYQEMSKAHSQKKSQDDLYEAARILESLTGAPPPPTIRRPMTRQEKREQDQRVRRFLALPPSLQEGALRYGENLRSAYRGKI